MDGVEGVFRKGKQQNPRPRAHPLPPSDASAGTDLLPLVACRLRSSAGISTFGPTPTAAQMEGSKSFSKEFMARHEIPTASFKTFKAAQFDEAREFVKNCGHRVVLKADGLAGGKGVLIPETFEEAEQGLKDVMVDQVFGAAGAHTETPLHPSPPQSMLTRSTTLRPLSRSRDRD